jgi:hypothetical protein
MASLLSCVVFGCGDPQDPNRVPLAPRAVVHTEDEQQQVSGCVLGYIDGAIYDCFPGHGGPSRAVTAEPGDELVVELKDANAENLHATVVADEDDQTLYARAEVSGDNREWKIRLPKEFPPRPYLQISANLKSFEGAIHAFRVDLNKR